MSTLCLTRRKAQLQLLADACARAARARIGLRRPGTPGRLSDTRLRALARDAVFVEAPLDPALRQAAAGQSVEVIFEERGERYAFSASLRGLADPAVEAGGAVALLRLGLPLRLERRPPRRYLRWSLPPMPAIAARLTNICDQTLALSMRLTEVSEGGLTGIVDRHAAAPLATAGPFWAEFCLPDDSQTVECVVRLVHCEAGPGEGQTLAGWTFCGSDGPSTSATHLARIRRFLVEHKKRGATSGAMV